jgi:hypothetical protein
MKVNKNLYYCKCLNFGDELNKYLFEKVFDMKFNYCTDVWLADYAAIGSVLGFGLSCKKPVDARSKISYLYKLLRSKIYFSKLTVLGSGFQNWSNEYEIKFLRKIDFKIVRGKLTENYLREHNLLKNNVLLGDLGLLCPYMHNNMANKPKKKYKLGIIPHLYDLNSPVIYDLYKKCGKNCILINVQDNVDIVINQIIECETVISSSLHGLIVADSFYIPNIWFENTLKQITAENRELGRFKYRDYYSIYGINDIEPLNILNIIDINIETIPEMYKIKKNIVEEKQKELYAYCKTYFENIKAK